MTTDLSLEQQQAIAMASARQRMATPTPDAPEPGHTPDDALGIANQAANLGLSYWNSRSMGIVPKIESAVGAGMAYPVVAAGKTMEGEPIPSYGDLYKMGVDGVQSHIAQSRTDNPWLTAGAELGGAVKTGNELADTKAGQAVSDWVGGAPLAAGASRSQKMAALLARAGKSALTGELGYRAYKVGNAAPGTEGDEAVSGAPVGGVLGFAGPLVSAGANQLKDAITPAIDASKSDLVALAQKYNIPLGVDDLTDSKFYKTLISEGKSLPFSGAGDNDRLAQKAFNRGVAQTFGEDAEAITPNVISNAYKNLGDKFESFVNGKRFDVTPDFYSKLDDITNRASIGEYGADGAQFLKPNLDRVKGIIDGNDQIKGENLDRLRKEFAGAYRTGSGGVADLKGDLEDLLVNTITGGNKAEQDAITQAKYQYKNLKTVQGIALKDQVNGNISPALLTSAVKNKFGETALAKGQAGDLGNLARIGQLIKEQVPNSGTAQRTMARQLLTGGVGVGAAYAGGVPAVAAAGAGLGLNRVLQNRNMDPQLVAKILAGGTNDLQRLSSPVVGNIAQQYSRLLAGGQ